MYIISITIVYEIVVIKPHSLDMPDDDVRHLLNIIFSSSSDNLSGKVFKKYKTLGREFKCGNLIHRLIAV